MLTKDIILWVLGCFSTIFLSISFYFQICANINAKHGEGLSLNFQLCELASLAFYIIYNLIDLFLNDSLAESITDMVYSVHGIIICAIVLCHTLNCSRMANQVHWIPPVLMVLLTAYPLLLLIFGVSVGSHWQFCNSQACMGML